MSDIHALLITDLVDSTAVSGRAGDAAMAAWWQAHDRRARDLLQVWRGREIDRSDGFLLLFDLADDALGYALDYHRLLRAAGERDAIVVTARAGIHVGSITLRSNAPDDVARGAKPLEVDGLAKAVAARVMSVASGGQTLLTEAARDALSPGADWWTRCHGHWRLKGIAQPIVLFEVGATDRVVFQPPGDSDKAHRVVQRGEHWLPVREIGHSLPAEVDAFIGRQDALRRLSDLIDQGGRLVCIHGIGGIGKTRLALHYGWHWLGDFAAGVWFCDLSAARDLDGLLRAVAQGLQLPLGQGDALAQIGNAIAGRGPCLMVLDNFEQVVALGEATLGRWLARAPQARFVVTSRDVLHLSGEQVLELRPMDAGEGVELFKQRAAAVNAARTPDGERSELEHLIAMLDGLPLAIELAAARSRLLSPRELTRRMGQRFKLLAHGGRAGRQATLRATLDWSWEMLSGAERDALAQLSVFEGGATLAAIEATVERGTRDEQPLVDVLQSLVDKSLVRPIGAQRLGMLSTVHEYASEYLSTPGRFAGSGPEALALAQARHWRWFAGLQTEDAVADGCADLDNWIAATRRATAAGDAPAACATLEGAWTALQLRGPFALGVELAAELARLPSLTPAERSRVDRIAGWALRKCGRVAEARERFDAALAGAVASGDANQEARVRSLLGDLHVNEGRIDEGRHELQQALAIVRRIGGASLECQVIFSLGNVETYLGNLDAAGERYEHVLALACRCADRRWEGGALGNLGLVRDQQGRGDEARRLYESAIAVARELGDRQWEGNNLCNLGLLLHLKGDLAGARQPLAQALLTARELGHSRLECITSINLALVAGALGSNDEARPLLEGALQIALELKDRRTQGQVHGYLGALHARTGQLDAARASLQLGEALLEEVSDKLSHGLLLCDRAEYEQASGDGAAARRSADKARALAAQIAAGPGSELDYRLTAIDALLGR